MKFLIIPILLIFSTAKAQSEFAIPDSVVRRYIDAQSSRDISILKTCLTPHLRHYITSDSISSQAAIKMAQNRFKWYRNEITNFLPVGFAKTTTNGWTVYWNAEYYPKGFSEGNLEEIYFKFLIDTSGKIYSIKRFPGIFAGND